MTTWIFPPGRGSDSVPQVLGLGPRLEHRLAGRVEATRDDDLAGVLAPVAQVRRELVEDLGVALALEGLVFGHLPRKRELRLARAGVLEGRAHDPAVADGHDDQLGLPYFVVRAAEEEALGSLQGTHLDVERPAFAEIDLRRGSRPFLAGHPMEHV